MVLSRIRIRLVLALVLTLLVGQWAVTAHQYDFAAHPDGAACEFCLHLGSLDPPLPAAELSFPVLFAAEQPAAAVVLPVRPSSPARLPEARAPPTFFDA